MEDVNKLLLNFLSLSDLEYGSYEFGLIRIEIERTQIHFSSDVFVAVAVLVS